MKKKIVINDGQAGYGLSKKAYDFMGLDWEREVVWPLERNQPGISKTDFLMAGMAFKYDRENPKLVKCVEVLGVEAGIDGTYFIIVELPADQKYEIILGKLGGEQLILKE